jgi:transcriptional regulator with XRE-family HTH domain
MVTQQGTSPTDYKTQLGIVLTDLRKRSGKERAEAAQALTCSEAKIGTIERGRSAISALELAALLDLYGALGNERADVEHLAAEARRRRPRTPWGSVIPERLRRFFRLEETAIVIRYFHPGLVHGLAQTEEYAHALISAHPEHRPTDIPRLVQARMARQSRLTGSSPPELHLVLSEAAVRQHIGGPRVMRDQLHYLRDLAERPNVHVGVIPFTAGAHPSNGTPFTLLTTPALKTVVYLENLTDGIIVDEPDRVARYESAFKQLSGLVLPRGETIALLASLAAEL